MPDLKRIAASSYSNTAPLVWSFLYGSHHGDAELILDNAPARSAELLAQWRVDAALVPVIASQSIENARLIPNVCVGARKRVRSVCLVTRGSNLEDIRSVSLDTSSRTSVVLTKVIFREFLGFEPEWHSAAPNIDAMIAESDAALLIGDPALSLWKDEGGWRKDEAITSDSSLIPHPSSFRVFDLAELWHRHTGLGFVFAMWMTTRERCDIDFAAARDEGVRHIPAIAANYVEQTGLNADALAEYLSENISYAIDPSMQKGLELYLDLAFKNGLTAKKPELRLI